MAKKLVLLGFLILALGVVEAFVSGGYVSDFVSYLSIRRQHQTPMAMSVYFGVTVAVIALALPVATLVKIVAGYLFGVWLGFPLAVFSIVLGSTFTFLVSRSFLHDYVRSKHIQILEKFNRGFRKHGKLYLLFMRLVPLLPISVINLVMGLTDISIGAFTGVTALGILPITFFYVNLGSQLTNLNKYNVEWIGPVTITGLLLAILYMSWKLIKN